MELSRGSKEMGVCASVCVETLQPTLRKKLHSVGGCLPALTPGSGPIPPRWEGPGKGLY